MWTTACYESGVESIPDDHRRWLDEDVIACLDAKTRMLGVKIVTTNSYRLLRGVTDVLRNYWDLVYSRELWTLKFQPYSALYTVPNLCKSLRSLYLNFFCDISLYKIFGFHI